MNTIIGLLIIAIGSFGQSSSYVPINKIKNWSWESFWLVQGIFAWLIFPLFGALLSVPEGYSLYQILSLNMSASLKSIGLGVLWGIGSLTFGLSMRYLGIALGQSVALGTCSAFGTIIPALMAGDNLFQGKGLILLVGVCITLSGISVIGYAGALRSKNMSEAEKKAAIKDYALTKGLLVALLSGVMSACFALGLEAGKPLIVEGMNDLFKTLPATFMVTFGGFITNALYCLYQNKKNHSFSDYGQKEVMSNNLLFCALAGILWYSQFFGFGMGKSFLTEGSVMMAFSWCILMAFNVIFCNLWGVLLKEWKGVSYKTIVVLLFGLFILMFSLIFPNLF